MTKPITINECGQHAGIVTYTGDTCPMCRAIDLLIRAGEHLNSYIDRIDEKCAEWGCSCTFTGQYPCSQPTQNIVDDIEEFVS